MESQKISRSHLAPLAKESDVIDLSRLGTLRSWEEERYGGYIRELCRPVRKGLNVSDVFHKTNKDMRQIT
jgi:hypothetical protein